MSGWTARGRMHVKQFLNVESGQPAIDYLKASLAAGAHAITANKGTVVHGFAELSGLAREAGKHYFHEATVLDSAPVFSLFRETLPAVKLRGFSGVVNCTTNVIIEAMETGRNFDEGVKAAQELGVTETDPSHDVDGWDATVKVCALATVLMKTSLKPADVRREGIRSLDPDRLRTARAEGRPFKLVARARLSKPTGCSARRCSGTIVSDRSAGLRARHFAGSAFRTGHDAGLNDHVASSKSAKHRLRIARGFCECGKEELAADYADERGSRAEAEGNGQ
jgi:hypothetical protein